MVYNGLTINRTGVRTEGEIKMISRRELESYGVIMTDEQWKDFCSQMTDIQERMWEEDHPMDE